LQPVTGGAAAAPSPLTGGIRDLLNWPQ
jgi:hypothetical protein